MWPLAFATRPNRGKSSSLLGAVKIEPVGEFALKGIRRPLAAYNVLGALTATP
jgi:hypothetical protein